MARFQGPVLGGDGYDGNEVWGKNKGIDGV
jgi:hypothetical protein